MRIEGWNGEIGGPRWWARALSFAAVIGVLLGLIGPFGAYLNALPLRMLDSVGVAIAGAVLSGVLIPLQLRAGLRVGLPRPFTLAVAVMVTAIPVAVLSALFSRQLWPRHVADYGPGDWYFQALLMLGCVIGLWLLLEVARISWRRDDAPGASVPAGSDPPDQPPFDDRGVLCLQTEDNYVRIHRDLGARLELMPLHEAIARFGDADGLRVHRGWWVAAAAVEAAERSGRTWRLRLTNGLRVPVARNRVAAVRARGWLD